MEPVTSAHLRSFLQSLGERYQGFAAIYLLGGSALCLLGSPRATLDVDYTIEVATEDRPRFQAVLTQLAAEMRLDVEDVPLGEFIPLPPGAHERRRPIGRFGQLDAYIFDLYSIALSKIARGFEADLDDVVFMLSEHLIDLDELRHFFEHILPRAPEADIVPQEFEGYFAEVQRRARR